MSGEVVLMTLLGGLGTVFGPVVGAFVIVGLQNYLAQLGAWVTVVQGVIFVVCVLTFRRGIVGELSACGNRRRQRQALDGRRARAGPTSLRQRADLPQGRLDGRLIAI